MKEDVRIECAHRFDVSLEEGFAYITDIGAWPEYWPDLERVWPGSRWREPGDRARLVLRLLGRSVELDMTLERFDRPRFIAYTSVQQGLPDARYERHFTATDNGFEYRLVVELERRSGLRGAFDRLVVRRAVQRALRRTVANLEQRLVAHTAERRHHDSQELR